MTNVEQAFEWVMAERRSTQIAQLPLSEAQGKSLAVSVYAGKPYPPFDRVQADGIALRYEDFRSGARVYLSVGEQRAGEAALRLSSHKTCVRVYSGAMLPEGADTVIPDEQLEWEPDGRYARVKATEVMPWQLVYTAGSDHKQGELLIAQGALLSPAEIGVLAFEGISEVAVYQPPVVAVISVGKELVDVEDTPLDGQLRDSNVYAVAAALRRKGMQPQVYHLEQEEEVSGELMRGLLDSCQAVLLTGGVSKTLHLRMPEILASMGVTSRFRGVTQRPGRGFWFGAKPEGAVVFGLPGNPLSTFLCLYRYVLPWLRQTAGVPMVPLAYAKLAEHFACDPEQTRFLQVKLIIDTDGVLWGVPLHVPGKGDFVNLTQADAFIELPAGSKDFALGSGCKFWDYRVRQ